MLVGQVAAPLGGAAVSISLDGIWMILILGAATGVISITLTKALIFKDLREAVKARSKWFGKLLSCPFCSSFWIGAIWIGIYQPRALESSLWPVDLILSVFLDVAVSAVWCGIIFKFIGWIGPDEDEEEEKT